MMKDVARLAECPLFEGIDPEELRGLLDCLGAREMRYERGATILREGEPAREVGVLLKGRAQVLRTDFYGSRSILMSVAPGELFAEAFACSGAEPLPVSVAAVEDCHVLFLDCRRVMTTCSHACVFHSRIVFNLLQIVARKNLALHRRAMITAGRTTRDKLMTYLLMAAKEAGQADFTIPYDRQGLADYLEVDRSGLSSELSKLRHEGVLDYYRSDFRLLRGSDPKDTQE